METTFTFDEQKYFQKRKEFIKLLNDILYFPVKEDTKYLSVEMTADGKFTFVFKKWDGVDQITIKYYGYPISSTKMEMYINTSNTEVKLTKIEKGVQYQQNYGK